jgi:hypothetical protein
MKTLVFFKKKKKKTKERLKYAKNTATTIERAKTKE